MEYYDRPTEITMPPPEQEMRKEQEITALPPEFGQGSGSPEEPAPKKSRLRQLLSIPAVFLVIILFLQGAKTSPVPGPEESVPEPLPVESATEIPELPEGSVVIDMDYCGNESGTVIYSYNVYKPTPTTDAFGNTYVSYGDTPWPVSVYAEVSDQNGKAVKPADDPDVWDDFRSLREYAINAENLSGELTLRLVARYMEEGEERQTIWSGTLPEFAPKPVTSAVLEAIPGGEVDVVATLTPQIGDSHDYDLEVTGMGQMVYWEETTTGLSLGDDPGSILVTGDNIIGYTVHYTGGSAAASIPEGAELSIYVILTDKTTGRKYVIETNRVKGVPPAETEEYPTYPLEDGMLVITVYNDTLTFDIPSQVEVEDYRTILAVDVIPEAEFTQYGLPAARTPDGYEFTGWVIHVNNPLDFSSEVDVFGEYNGDPPVDVLINDNTFAYKVYGTLTPEDIERIPPTEDGTRFVNVHATWIKQEPDNELLLMDDGQGNVIVYGMDSPIASEGYLYLCNYPVPEREDMTFDGWYDDDGNKVELLMCYFSFVPMMYDEDGHFIGYDWGTAKPVHLTAHWK